MKTVTLAAAIACLASHAGAQLPPSLDTWVDACDVTDRDLLQLTSADVALVAGFLHQNHDGSYRLDREAYTYIPFVGPDYALCTDSRFYGQFRPNGFPAGRSGVLVGPDLVLTANHNFAPGQVPNHDFVFGLRQQRDASGACVPPDLDHIPARDVYHAVEIVAQGDDTHDFILVRLDRPVAGGRAPVRVRRSGAGRPGDRATVIGHPEMLLAKVDVAATYKGTTSAGQPRIHGAHTLVGSSGSLIYDRDAQMLEGVVYNYGCASYRQTPAGCWQLASACAPDGSVLGDGIVTFADNVPAFELVVDSLADVVHMAPVGGPLPNPTTAYTLSSPATASGPIRYLVLPPRAAAPGEPSLTLQMSDPLQGDLAPGKTLGAQTTASIVGVGCGRYERPFEVRDETHGFRDQLRHVFEIGLTEFQTKPHTDLEVADLAPPFAATASYEISNPRPDPVSVRVAADRDWLTLNGLAATAPGVPPSLVLVLAPKGQDGDRATVVVGIGGYAGDLRLGEVHEAHVAFTNASTACENLGAATRTVTFLPGQATFQSPPPAVPIPDGDTAGVVSPIGVPEAACVGQVRLSVHTTGQNANHLSVALTSPDGRRVRLWDHHGLDHTDIRRFFDDATSPAPTGERLAAFVGATSAGRWRLELVDSVPGGPNALESWGLTITSSGTPPCAP